MNTYLSANSKAAVRFEIMRHPHWLLQLRQARLFIYEKEQTLAQTYYKQKTSEILQRQMKRKLEDLKQLLTNPPTDKTIDKIELQEQIDLTEIELDKSINEYDALNPLIKDAMSELEEARKIELFIYGKYPQSSSLNYEEIQDLYAEEALLAIQAKNAAIKVLALQNGIPESLAQTLIDLPTDQKQTFLDKMQDNLSSVSQILRDRLEAENAKTTHIQIPETSNGLLGK